MPARKHYTLRARKDVENARDEEDAAAKIRGELGDHYDATFTIALQRRNPTSGKWEDSQVLDILHDDGTDLTPEAKALEATEKTQRIEELAEDLVAMAETEASIDGGARWRALGRAERVGKAPLWEVPWIAGGPLLESERKLQAADANVSALTSTVRALESSHRLLERTWRTNTAMAESAKGYHDAMVGNVTKTLETLQKLEEPSIAKARLTLEQQDRRATHETSMAEEQSNHELLLEALGLLGKALDADRRDRKEDRKRGRGEVIDTSARDAAPKNGAPPNGSNGAPTNGASSSASASADAPDMRRPEMPRCAEAKELLEILDDLEEPQAAKIRELLTPDEMAAIFACADAPTREDFDRLFHTVDALWQKRGQHGTTALQTELGSVLGLRAFTLKSIVIKWERRAHGRPATA